MDKVGHWRHALEPSKIIFLSQTLPTSLSTFSGPHEVSISALPHTPCHDVLPHHRPKNNVASQPWTETMSQNKSFLL
jgi:hypothetical protein